MGPPPRWVIGVLGALLSLGSPGCTETGVGPADDDGTPDDDATADNDTVADDDSAPDDVATPDDDATADDDTVPDHDNTPSDDTTAEDDSSAADDDTTPPLPCEVVPGPPDCGDSADADCGGTADVDDCAPADPRIHPGMLEVCGDAVDDNCDGLAPPSRHEGEIELDVDDPTCADAIITAPVPASGLGTLAALIGDVDGDGSGDLFVERFKTEANG